MSKCSYPMVLHADQDDGWRWKCNNKISERKQKAVACGGHVRFRKGTFFAGSHLSYFNILAFAHLWAEGVQLRVIKLELGVGSDQTLVNWSSYCREVCTRWFSTLFLLVQRNWVVPEWKYRSTRQNLVKENSTGATQWRVSGFLGDMRFQLAEYLWSQLKIGFSTFYINFFC